MLRPAFTHRRLVKARTFPVYSAQGTLSGCREALTLIRRKEEKTSTGLGRVDFRMVLGHWLFVDAVTCSPSLYV